MHIPTDIVIYFLVGLVLFIIFEVVLWRAGKVGKIISILFLAVVTLIAIEIYMELYPLDSFYENEFTKVTGYDFPASGRIRFKEASYPDIHGDYTSCAVIEVSEKDYMGLRSKIGALSPYRAEDECMYHLWGTLDEVEFIAESSQCDAKRAECKYWALVAGRPAVVIHFASW